MSKDQILIRPLAMNSTINLSKGVTPLVQSRWEPLKGTWLKLEGCNPTGSFKDRIMGVLVDEAKLSGAKMAIVASSGNAAVSACSNAAKRGLMLVVIVPISTPSETIHFLSRYPIFLIRYGVNPSDSHSLAKRMSLSLGVPNLSSTFSESGAEFGCRTIGHEISAQLPDQEIRTLAAAVSVGPVLIGARNGLLETGRKSPRLVAGQASGCSPIVRAFESGSEKVEAWSGAVETAALSIADTLRNYEHEGAYFLQELRKSEGFMAAGNDSELLHIKGMLREFDGIETEISCCAAIFALLRSGLEGESTVAVLTGSGIRQTVADSFKKEALSPLGFQDRQYGNESEQQICEEISAWIS